MKRLWMLDVLRVVNFGFWSHLECFEENAIINYVAVIFYFFGEGLILGFTQKYRNIYLICLKYGLLGATP